MSNPVKKMSPGIGFLLFFFVWLTLICQPVLGQTDDAILAWGKMDNNGYNIYFSRRTQQNWSAPEQLSFSDHLNILPTLASNAHGDIWVAWTAINNSGGEIKFCHYQDNKWNLPKSIQTDNTSDMAPSTIVDGNGDAWLVWSGTDGADDDIFFSRWENGQWALPLKVNTDDLWPDILPQMSLTGTGLPQVTWSGYDGEKYSTFTSHWTGTNWSPEQTLEEPVDRLLDSIAKSSGTDMATIISSLPDFVTDINQASIHFTRQGKANTIRLKSQ